jgi:hypothetical protein
VFESPVNPVKQELNSVPEPIVVTATATDGSEVTADVGDRRAFATTSSCFTHWRKFRRFFQIPANNAVFPFF